MNLKILTPIVMGLWFFVFTPLAGGHPAPQRVTHKTRPSSPSVARCVSKDVRQDEIAEYGINGARNVTVGEKLKELKASCDGTGILRGRRGVPKGRTEIRFFRKTCNAYPVPNYLELQAEERRNLETLKSKYTVIVIGCDPRIP
jgi:hypothetical protein